MEKIPRSWSKPYDIDAQSMAKAMSERHVAAALKWTPEQDDLLKSLHAEGLSGSQVGAEINAKFHTIFSRNAVIGRKKRLGLTVIGKRRGGWPKAKKWAEPVQTREEIVLRCVEVEPRHLRLLDLDDGDCRYPYSDGPFTFCGLKALPGLPYCRAHMALAVRPR